MSTEPSTDNLDDNPLPEVRGQGWRVYFEEEEIGERTTVTDTTLLADALETAVSTIASYGSAGIEYTTADGETWVAYLPSAVSAELLHRDFNTGPVWQYTGQVAHPMAATAYHVERLTTQERTGHPYGTDLAALYETGLADA